MTPAPLTVLAPMRIEARAVRTGAPGTRLVTTGMGPRRAREWGRRVPVGPAAVLGLAGGLGRGVRPGDVVVATSVGDGRDSLELPDPRLLAAALRRAGLRAHLGPVASSERLVTGAERGRLAAAGALAADMESFWLLRHHQGPATVVRAVLDTAAEDLLTGVPVNALVAYRSLQAAAPVVAAWGRAVRPRTVLLAGPRSFCAGVERAIDIVERAIDRFGPPVYVRRQIVHNRHVVERLERRGAVFVMELDEVPEHLLVLGGGY
ncbi:MAG TPA: hypothetical protein VFH45_06680, partial [Acidimicrobiales bacterium]|nr:hypothetical protein [Acidimicrobiales bacterium]